MDHRPAAQPDVALFLLLDRRTIGGVGHVDGHADLRIDAEGAGPGPAQAELLLHRRDGVEAARQLAGIDAAEGLDHDPQAGLVVHGRGDRLAVAHSRY